jgi:hypothetical protein
VILDSSAIVTIILREAGSDRVLDKVEIGMARGDTRPR